MKSFIRCAPLACSLVALLLLSAADPSLASSGEARCLDVAARGKINVLTINLLFSEIRNRETRLESIANFLQQQADAGEPVDIVLLQEVVGGPLSRTRNSSLDLANLLASKGLNYNLRYRMANGLQQILSVGNSILSRCEIVLTLSKTLPFESEELLEGFQIPLRRKVIMTRVEVPGFGKINVYNTHLCPFCDPGERLEQAQVLMSFIDMVEGLIAGKNPIILGGDFNTNRNLPGDLPVYNLITQDKQFTDTFASFNSCTDCCSQGEGFAGCTFAVAGNPFATNPFTGQPEDPVRIDYIFTKGGSLTIDSSVVVFNSDPWVSDHSGVLTRITLP